MTNGIGWLQRYRLEIAVPVLMVVTALILRAFSFTTAGLDWDESLYIVIAQRWLHSGLPYVAVWDQHPMGLPAIFTGFEWLIGDGLLAVRIACFIAVTGTAILLPRFLIRFCNEPLAGILAGLCYLFYMSRPEGLAANTEVFNNLVVAAASFLLYGEMTRPIGTVRGSVVFAASLLFGIGLQIKYVVIPEAIFLCSALLVYQWCHGLSLPGTLRLAGISIAGGLLPTILMTVYFWQEGALQPYLDGNLRANIVYLGDRPGFAESLLLVRYGLLPLLGLLPWPFALLWLSRDETFRRRYGMLMTWLLIWLVAAAIDVVLPMKLWKHYFNALIPPLCIAGSLIIVVLARKAQAWRPWALTALLAVTLLPAVGSIIKHEADSRSIDRQNVPRAIAQTIKRDGTNGHDVYVFNYDALVYAYADATPPTRYVLGIDLAEFNMFSGANSQSEIGRILAGKPRWIIKADPSPYIYTASEMHEIDTALQQYRVAATFDESDYIQPPITVRLYERDDQSAATGSTGNFATR